MKEVRRQAVEREKPQKQEESIVTEVKKDFSTDECDKLISDAQTFIDSKAEDDYLEKRLEALR